MRRPFVHVAVAGMLLHASVCPAQSSKRAVASSDVQQAKAFFEIGVQAYERGRYQDAAAAFQEAYQRSRRPGLLFSLAQVYRRAFFVSNEPKHLEQAIVYYREYLKARDSIRRDEAEQVLSELVPIALRLNRSSVPLEAAAPSTRLMVSSRTVGASLTIDGKRVSELPHVTELVPGLHRVRVSAPGFVTEERAVSLPAGAAFAVNIELAAMPAHVLVQGPPGADIFGRSCRGNFAHASG